MKVEVGNDKKMTQSEIYFSDVRGGMNHRGLLAKLKLTYSGTHSFSTRITVLHTLLDTSEK